MFSSVYSQINQLNKTMEQEQRMPIEDETLYCFSRGAQVTSSYTAYIKNKQKFQYTKLNLSDLVPQKDPQFEKISRLRKYSVSLFGSNSLDTPEMNQNKIYVLDVKHQDEIYKVEPLKYLLFYQANTAYQIKKALDYKKEDPEFKSQLIKNVQIIEQDFKERYSRKDDQNLNVKEIKIYLQNCPSDSYFQCLQNFKVCMNKSYKIAKRGKKSDHTQNMQQRKQ